MIFIIILIILLLSCMVGFAFVLDWKDVQEKCALHTLSRTWRLGNTVLRARQQGFPR